MYMNMSMIEPCMRNIYELCTSIESHVLSGRYGNQYRLAYAVKDEFRGNLYHIESLMDVMYLQYLMCQGCVAITSSLLSYHMYENLVRAMCIGSSEDRATFAPRFPRSTSISERWPRRGEVRVLVPGKVHEQE